MKLLFSFLIIFSVAFAQPYSDIRLEIISKIKKLEEQKEKTKDKKKLKKINKEIKNLKDTLKKYEENSITAG